MPRRAPRFAVYAHPWALGDVGVERALNELAAAGVDGIQLSLSYHAASVLTPRSPRRRVFHDDRGSAYFDYQAAAPGPWRLRPRVLADAAEVVPRVIEGAAARDIQVVAWLVYLYGHDLASRHPDLAVRDAWGSVHPAQLCPSQPAVREHALRLTSAALSLDPTGAAFGGLHAESLSFLPWSYGLPGPKAAVRLDASAARMLGLCFCDACRGRAREAGLDPDAAARTVRSLFDASVAGASPARGRDEAAAYSDLLAGATLELNREAAALVAARDLRFSSTAGESEPERGDRGAAAAVNALVDEVRVRMVPGATAAQVTAWRDAALTGCRPGTHAFAQYRLPDFQDGAALTAAVSAARSAGIESHRFYEFSLLAEEHLGWLRACREQLDVATA
ncbi:MAG TPA: hypothetical protein VF164_00360 [Trueperaceae bacterium]